jgi:hypothetical protein
LVETLEWLKSQSGFVSFDSEATRWYDEWYRERKDRLETVESDMQAEVIARGKVHAERIACLVHLAECRTHVVCLRCLKTAIALLDYLESKIPAMVNAMERSAPAKEAAAVLGALTRLGGASDHSHLLRRSRMGATEFKRHINSLVEMKKIRMERRGVVSYYIMEDTG